MISPGFEIEEDTSRIHVDLTPLIDVVFMLIVFLLLTANAAQLVIEVDTPDASFGEASETEAYLLVPPDPESADWNFDGQSYSSPEAATTAISNVVAAEDDAVILIAISAETSAQHLIDAMDVARDAGAQTVEIAVDQK
ncbi:biopolymer transporter ExbD [Ponticaulis sp.]|uniref:ExbD/TolR family protein n=1 Tax=Ponticaulis sp. TaxID=2020902 RepID=UPI0025F59A16|nr:biopolymer transporter ExbD [Ponticaulis sp.]